MAHDTAGIYDRFGLYFELIGLSVTEIVNQQNIDLLSKYIPAPAAPIISKWIDAYQVELKMARNRQTKFGDYRHPHRGEGHRISVNHNLNPYNCLVTLVHEFAHLVAWNRHQNKVKPHGAEWKLIFQQMMQPFFDIAVFPEDIHKAISVYLKNPAASSCSDLSLMRTLQRYDHKKEAATTVERLPIETIFSLKNGRTFQKKELIRKRYRCIEVKTKRIYLFNPLAEVYLLEQPE